MGEISEKLITGNFNSKLLALFDIFEEVYNELCIPKLEEIKYIFDKDHISTDENFKDEVIDTLMDLFGFEVQDYSYFDEEKRAKIKKNWFNNIFIFYKDRLKADLYLELFYVYEITASYFHLITSNWTDFYRLSSLLDAGIVTDVGFFVDQNLLTDESLYRTPFLEIEINLIKLYDNQHYTNNIFTTMLWFKDIDDSIKKDIENIRYVLSKMLYTLRLDLIGRINETISYYQLITSEITKLIFINDIENNNSNYNEEYFDLYVNISLHRFWFNVDFLGSPPNNGGGVLHEINILSTDIISNIILKSINIINNISGLSVTTENTDNIEITHLEGITTNAETSNENILRVEIINNGINDNVNIWVSSFYDHASVHNYKITFADDTEYTDIISVDYQLNEDDNYYYIGIINNFNEIKFLKKLEIYTITYTLLLTINFPYTYLAVNDKMYFYIRIEK